MAAFWILRRRLADETLFAFRQLGQLRLHLSVVLRVSRPAHPHAWSRHRRNAEDVTTIDNRVFRRNTGQSMFVSNYDPRQYAFYTIRL